MKRLFRNAFSERSKRSEKERDERSLHGVPAPCSQIRPFLLAELKRDTPRNFDMKRLIRNAFSERPKKGGFPEGWLWRMFPRNENRNEGTYERKTGPRVRLHVPPKQKPERGYVRQTTLLRNHPFVSSFFCLVCHSYPRGDLRRSVKIDAGHAEHLSISHDTDKQALQ